VTVIELWVMFTLGLVSSLHCVQMCGPIVLSYSVALDQNKQRSNRVWVPLLSGHLAYNAGRILTYAALGALAGLAGKTVGLIGRLAGVGSVLAIVGGSLMMLAGVVMLGALPAMQSVGGSLFRVTGRFIRPLTGLVSSAGVGRRFLLGLALGLLPCGLIYAALLRALATGSAFWGAATMAAFGAGTAGALLAVGIFSSAIRGTIRRWGSQLAAVSVMIMGALLVMRGAMPGILMGARAHVCH